MEAGELYLSLMGPNGRVAGEVQAEGYVDQIDVLDWSWSAALSKESSDAAPARNVTGNRIEPATVTLNKRIDRSSTALMSGATNLTKYPKAVLTLLDRGEGGLKLVVTLEQVRIESYKLEIKDQEMEVAMTENLVLGFETIRIEYTGRRNDKGIAATRSYELRAPK